MLELVKLLLEDRRQREEASAQTSTEVEFAQEGVWRVLLVAVQLFAANYNC